MIQTYASSFDGIQIRSLSYCWMWLLPLPTSNIPLNLRRPLITLEVYNQITVDTHFGSTVVGITNYSWSPAPCKSKSSQLGEWMVDVHGLIANCGLLLQWCYCVQRLVKMSSRPCLLMVKRQFPFGSHIYVFFMLKPSVFHTTGQKRLSELTICCLCHVQCCL